MPRCTSMPWGRLACSAGIGQTRGAWSLQDTWQMKEQTTKKDHYTYYIFIIINTSIIISDVYVCVCVWWAWLPSQA